MPEYTFICDKCEDSFSIFARWHDLDDMVINKTVVCPNCRSKSVSRDYIGDCSTISGSVKKSDNELKTIGDLANRNRDKMSDDKKIHLHQKHNSYKEEVSEKPLPKGMSRMKKPPKTIWPK